ncbi:hypothetical protein BH20ACT21_BH20ACT21_18410 [soil metagenome]
MTALQHLMTTRRATPQVGVTQSGQMTEDKRRNQDDESGAPERSEPDQAPVDGPSPGGEGNEDELGSTSQDKPGGH